MQKNEGIEYDDGIPVSDMMEQSLAIRRLLVKIIRIAALDWILYKDRENPVAMRRALDAYFWLFIEGPGEPAWEERKRNGTEVTAFLNICDALDFDPEVLRQGILRIPTDKARTLEREPTGRERPLEFEQLHRGEVSLDRQDICDVCNRADLDADAVFDAFDDLLPTSI